jgi:hypothetical protein
LLRFEDFSRNALLFNPKFQKMPRISILIFFIFLGLSLFAQKVSPSINFESNDVLIGDQIKATLTVETNQGKNVNFPNLNDYWNVANIEILNLSNVEKTNSDGGKQIFKQHLLIVFWDTGSYVLPAVPFNYSNNEKIDTVLSSETRVKVRYPEGITGDSTFMAPIKPILEETKSIWDYILDYKYPFFCFLGLLLVLALIFLIVLRIRKQASQKLQLSPEAKTLAALNKLLESDYPKKGQHALYHEGVSFIMRSYLNERYGIKALESISAEILEDMKQFEISESLINELRELLETADLVKYAKASPLPAADKFSADFIRKFVNATLEAQNRQKV